MEKLFSLNSTYETIQLLKFLLPKWFKRFLTGIIPLFIFSGPRYVVQIGEKVIDYNEDFK